MPCAGRSRRLLLAIGFVMIMNGALANALCRASCPTRSWSDDGGVLARRRRPVAGRRRVHRRRRAHAVGVAIGDLRDGAADGQRLRPPSRRSYPTPGTPGPWPKLVRCDVPHLPVLPRRSRRNEAIEQFPVGRRLAFDAAKGRLWVVCRKCERWNLSPLEERWEAIEECERPFRATRLRVSTDNIGLAQLLPEGLELVRIGDPPASGDGRLAIWRPVRSPPTPCRYLIVLAKVAAPVGVVAGPVMGLIAGGGDQSGAEPR